MTVWQIAAVVAAAALLALLTVAVVALRTLREIRDLMEASAKEKGPEPHIASGVESLSLDDPRPVDPRVTVAARRHDLPVTGRPVDERRTAGSELPTSITAGHTDRPDRLATPRITSGAVVHGFRTAFAAQRSRREIAEARAAAGRSRRATRGGGTERVGQQR